MQIELSPEASQFVESLVAEGEYASASDAVTAGVRLLMARQRLRADVQKGIEELDAGPGIDGELVFDELRQRLNKIIETTD